jgi:hypothetical protein
MTSTTAGTASRLAPALELGPLSDHEAAIAWFAERIRADLA